MEILYQQADNFQTSIFNLQTSWRGYNLAISCRVNAISL